MTDQPISGYIVGAEGDRRRKADAISAVIGKRIPIWGAKLLEIGSGTGYMAQRFGELVGPSGSCTSVDIRDERSVTDGYEFELVTDTRLPFDGGAFDIVISNHVIEHVGDTNHQLVHLRELARMLGMGGVAYVAAPNRYRLIEQHYHLPFLSWLPAEVGNTYVRWTGRGDGYDVNPVTRRQLRRWLDTQLCVSDVTIDRWLVEHAARLGPQSLSRLNRFLSPMRRLLPVTVLLGIKP